ncbi:hypothetical protein, partial [[Ruminococcus] torques]
IHNERAGKLYLSRFAWKGVLREMKMDETEYTELYMELEKYEKRGIDMLLDGYQASPLQIVTAHMVKEAGTYMRDYTMSGDGNIETLRFTDINEHFRAEITP